MEQKMRTGQKILDGLTEAIAFAQGDKAGAIVRQVQVPPSVNVRAIRDKLGLSQREFALRFGFSLGTIRNWEQGHRGPEGSARALLTIIDREPAAVERALALKQA
jgi:putative transcriptional regulator